MRITGRDALTAKRHARLQTDWETFVLPDWRDDGRRIVLRLASGRTVRGTLRLDDALADEDGDEFPIWKVVLDDGVAMPWTEAEEWRFA